MASDVFIISHSYGRSLMVIFDGSVIIHQSLEMSTPIYWENIKGGRKWGYYDRVQWSVTPIRSIGVCSNIK